MNNESITIRSLKTADAEIYRTVRIRMVKENPEAFLVSYSEEIKETNENFINRFKHMDESNNEEFILGAFKNGTLIGTVGFFRENFEKAKHKGVIWGMYVVPEERGKNTGRKLLKEAIKSAKQLNGLEKILISVIDVNIEARNLYLTEGFKIFGHEKGSIKIGDKYFDEDYMQLDLDNINAL